MKLPAIFTKVPSYKRFGYTPRFYDEQKEEMKAREERIRAELKLDNDKDEIDSGYRQRIAGSFKHAKKTATPQADPSSNMIRLVILLFLTLWLIAIFQFGKSAIYAGMLLVPFYFYLKFRKFKK